MEIITFSFFASDIFFAILNLRVLYFAGDMATHVCNECIKATHNYLEYELVILSKSWSVSTEKHTVRRAHCHKGQ